MCRAPRRHLALLAAAVLGSAMISCARGGAPAAGSHAAAAPTRTLVLARQTGERGACRPANAVSTPTPRASAVPLQETAPVMFRINQVGYVASCPKLALVMTPGARVGRRFDVLSASGRVVYRGRAPTPERWNS